MSVFGLFKFSSAAKKKEPITDEKKISPLPFGKTTEVTSVKPVPTRSRLDELLQAGDAAAALAMLPEINEEEQLAGIAYRCKFSPVAAAAAGRIERFDLIVKVLRNSSDKKVGKILLDKLSAVQELETVAASALSRYLQNLAREKLARLRRPEPVVEVQETEHSFAANREQIEAFEQLCIAVEKLTGRFDPEGLAEMERIKTDWSLLPPPPLRFMEILEKRFRQAEADFQTGAEVARQQEQRRQEMASRFAAWCDEAEKMAAMSYEPAMEAQWKRLKADWEHGAASFAPGEEFRFRYVTAGEKMAAAAAEFQQRLDEVRQRVTGWVGEIEAVIEAASVGLKEASSRMKEIRELMEHDPAAGQTEFRESFLHCRQLLNRFFARLKNCYAAEEYDRCANLVIKQDLLRQAEALRHVEEVPKVAAELKKLHTAWRNSGRAHRDEESVINQSFRDLCDELHRRCDEYYEALRQERRHNLEIKTGLADEAEALQNSDDWHTAAEQVKEIQRQWKATGPGPKEEEAPVYQRFKNACDAFFSRRRQHIDVLKEEWERNAAAKRELIAAAGELVAMEPRQAIVRARELRQWWKQAPAADHRTEQALWEEFNGMINRFFAELDAHQDENVAAREALCGKSTQFLAELEQMTEIDFYQAARRAEELVAEWKQAGPIPRHLEAELWERFDLPLKKFYAMRQEFLARLDEKRAANLTAKNHLLEELEGILSNPGDSSASAERIKELQRRWKETGSAAPEQEKELWADFNGLCNDFFNRRRSSYEEHVRQQEENGRRKVDLCVRMEKLAGIEAPEGAASQDEKSLAKELEMALQCRGIEVLDRHQALEVGRSINEEWRKIGFSGQGESRLQQRFARAREAFFRN